MINDSHLQQRMLQLAKELLRRTSEGAITWSPTDIERRFLFTGTNTSVTIDSYVDEENDNVTTISILNSRGTVVESMKNEWGAEYSSGPGTAGVAPWNKAFDDLYFAARRSALNIDGLLDSLFTDLNDPPDNNNTGEADSDETPF